MLLTSQPAAAHVFTAKNTKNQTAPISCSQVLEAQGQAAVSPADRSGLHPLLIPLAQQQGGSGSGELTCLLRWPEGHKGMELPVVSQARGGTQVRGCCLACWLRLELSAILHRATSHRCRGWRAPLTSTSVTILFLNSLLCLP